MIGIDEKATYIPYEQCHRASLLLGNLHGASSAWYVVLVDMMNIVDKMNTMEMVAKVGILRLEDN